MTVTAEIPLNSLQGLNLHQGDSLRVLAETEKSLVVEIRHLDHPSPIILKGPVQNEPRRDLFARRFAPLAEVPDRDLSDIINENRGEA